MSIDSQITKADGQDVIVDALVKAKELIAAAQSVQDVIAVRNKAKAAQECIKQAKLGKEIENQAAELRIRAEHKAGLFLKQTNLAQGRRSDLPLNDRLSLSSEMPSQSKKTLSELGISSKESSRWQMIAELSEIELDGHIEKIKTRKADITQSKFIDLGKEKKLERKKKDFEQKQAAVAISMAIEVTEKPIVQLGETWELGRHFLYCQDSSDWRSVKKAKMVFADPPYNAGVADWDVDFEWKHDWLTASAEYVFVTPGSSNLQAFLASTSMRYRWIYTHWLCNGISVPNDWGMSNLIQVLLFSDLKSLRLERRTDFCKANINQGENNITEHPGQKPSSLLIWLLDLVTKPGDLILDPFLGSGTTLLAAEECDRVCHGVEINPKYCSEVIARWKALTKGKVKKIDIPGNRKLDRVS